MSSPEPSLSTAHDNPTSPSLRDATRTRTVASFLETRASLSAPYQQGRHWDRVREGAISFPTARGKRGTKGPRPLVSMCLRVLADNICAASKDMIAELPGRLQSALWKELLPRQVQ